MVRDVDSKENSGEVTCRVGQNRIYTPYMTVCLVISLPKTPYIHRIFMVQPHMVLANPSHAIVPVVHRSQSNGAHTRTRAHTHTTYTRTHTQRTHTHTHKRYTHICAHTQRIPTRTHTHTRTQQSARDPMVSCDEADNMVKRLRYPTYVY